MKGATLGRCRIHFQRSAQAGKFGDEVHRATSEAEFSGWIFVYIATIEMSNSCLTLCSSSVVLVDLETVFGYVFSEVPSYDV